MVRRRRIATSAKNLPVAASTALETAASEFLSLLELSEQRAHRWGRFDVVLNDDNLFHLPSGATPTLERALEGLREHGLGLEAVVSHLHEVGALRECPEYEGERGDARYRTRYGETLRLLFSLRQVFKVDKWAESPRLVSDVHAHLARRRLPRRDVDGVAFLDELRTQAWSESQLHRLGSLLATTSGTLALSQFQAESVATFGRLARDRRDRGLIISAGTGFGKTKAFYLPALSFLDTDRAARSQVSILAVYPRIELLRDQLREAVSEVSKLNGSLDSERRVRVGCFYGDVPFDANDIRKKWEKVDVPQDGGPGYVCPFLARAPAGPAGRAVVLESDLRRGRNRLVSENPDSNWQTDSLVLTRKALRARPPDLLLITGDSLNRQLLDPYNRRLVTGKGAEGPRLLLIDEAHTYVGLQGAQYAHVLRRWRSMVEGPVLYTGLSATLADAQAFFANLCGLPEYRVRLVEPRAEDTDQVGMSYEILVKGDPTSGTALLSTTIQLTMLALAMRDPPGGKGYYGSKVFGFVDRLDTLNRWAADWRDSQRLDARSPDDIPLQAIRHPQNVLHESGAALAYRQHEGQVWTWASELGTNWEAPVVPDVVSSQQDTSVLTKPLVLATSSLEVGFDDPDVGVVIQHKAPREISSYLQRKGRAGRSPRMRPWTFVVLSDYGLDAELFDDAAELLAGYLRPLALPTANRYVRGIQAALAFLEWVARQVGCSVMKLRNSNRRDAAVHLLESLADQSGESRRRELRDHLVRALNVTAAEAEDLLWFQPRPVLLEVLPTLLRRITSPSDEDAAEFRAVNLSPLPEFIPSALFKSLLLPEVRIYEQQNRHAEDVMLALLEFVPGKVSGRYASRPNDRPAWVYPKQGPLEGQHALEDLGIGYEIVAEVARNGTRLPVCRPLWMRLRTPGRHVALGSTAQWIWDLEIEPTGSPVFVPCRRQSTVFLEAIHAYLHSRSTPLRVLRFAAQGEFSTSKNGKEERGRFTLTTEQRDSRGKGTPAPAALGVELKVDAIEFRLRDEPMLVTDELWQCLRVEWFLRSLEDDKELAELANVFQIQWLWRIALLCLVDYAVQREIDIQTAADLIDENFHGALERALERIVCGTAPDSPDGAETPLFTRMQSLLELRAVREAIARHLSVLWEAPNEEFRAWTEGCYRISVAGAIRGALVRLHPDLSFREFEVDVYENSVWISEQAVGGVGLVQRIVEQLQENPGLFDRVIADTAQHSSRYAAVDAVSALLESIWDPDLRRCLDAIRSDPSVDAWERANQDLLRWSRENAIPLDRRATTLLYATVLRSGSDDSSDALAVRLHAVWRTLESRLNLAIPREIFAHIATSDQQVADTLSGILKTSGGRITRAREVNVVRSLLWNDRLQEDTSDLEIRSRYSRFITPSRALLQERLRPMRMHPWSSDWETLAQTNLSQNGWIGFRIGPESFASAMDEITAFILRAIEVEGRFRFHPKLERLEAGRREWRVLLTIPELHNG